MCLTGLSALLKACGVDVERQVDVALNGREAVDSVLAARQLGLHYKLILTDISMPEMDGLEATRHIRDLPLGAVTIIGVTGHVHEAFKKQATEAGMNLVVPKPIYKS